MNQILLVLISGSACLILMHQMLVKTFFWLLWHHQYPLNQNQHCFVLLMQTDIFKPKCDPTFKWVPDIFCTAIACQYFLVKNTYCEIGWVIDILVLVKFFELADQIQKIIHEFCIEVVNQCWKKLWVGLVHRLKTSVQTLFGHSNVLHCFAVLFCNIERYKKSTVLKSTNVMPCWPWLLEYEPRKLWLSITELNWVNFYS